MSLWDTLSLIHISPAASLSTRFASSRRGKNFGRLPIS